MSKAYKDKNIQVTWAFDLKKKIRENFSNEEWAKQASYVVEQIIIPKISKGISPVNGERMFQKYKNPERYPGDLKASNKPNLTLTGSMLSYYDATAGKEPVSITIGMPKSTPKSELVKAVANNQGTQSSGVAKFTKNSKNRKLNAQVKASAKGIPARPFIPLKNQSFTKDIVLAIRKYLAYCLDKAIKKGT